MKRKEALAVLLAIPAAVLLIGLLAGAAFQTYSPVASYVGSTNVQTTFSGSTLTFFDPNHTTFSLKFENSDAATAFLGFTAGDDFYLTPSATGSLKVNGGVRLNSTANVISDNGTIPTYNGNPMPAANWTASSTNSTVSGSAIADSIYTTNGDFQAYPTYSTAIQRRTTIDAFRMGWDFGVFREDFNGVSTNDAYWPAISIGTNRYACWEIRRIANGSYWGPHELNSAQVRTCTVIYDQEFTNFVYSGSWTQTTGQSATWGTSYRRSNTSNDTVTVYVPTGSTLIALRCFQASNGGIGKVTIDGTTNANLLSTANDLVTAGTLASGVLVANGGNLNPSDRVIDFYLNGAAQDFFVPLADNLTAGTHTVVVTVTGDKRAAASDTRVYITAMNFGSPTYTLASSGAKLEVFRPNSDNVNSNAGSVYEYALQLAPNGASAHTNGVFIGNWHGFDIETGFALTNAGAAVTLTNFQVYAGTTNLLLTRTSSLRHPDINSSNTEIASVTVNYSVLPGMGLKTDWTITHETNGNAYTCYVGMMPVTPPITSGTTLGAFKDFALVNSDGSANATSTTDAAWLWDPTQTSGELVYFPYVLRTVNGWANTGTSGLWLEDRTGGAIKKAYLTRVGSGLGITYANGDVWTASAVYKIQQWSGGANTALARTIFAGH